MTGRSRADLPWWANLPEGTMPISADLMKTCVRVIGDIENDPLPGSHRGTKGSGFLVVVPSEAHPMYGYTYIVTAHHVIEDQMDIEVEFQDPFLNGVLLDPVKVRDWKRPLPKVDIAIAHSPLQGLPAMNLERHVMPWNWTPFLGSEIFYCGILEPLNRPMVRRGTIGALDQEGIDHKGYVYPCHLVDCRSYDGFSGSAVFLHTIFPILQETPPRSDDPTLPNDVPLGQMRHHVVLAGMFTEHLEDDRIVTAQTGVASRYGVGMVLRHREIREALLTDDMRKQRSEWDEKNMEAQNKGPKPRHVSAGKSEPSEDEFARFELLTKELVNTPKPGSDQAQ
jgi:hypothetical protein